METHIRHIAHSMLWLQMLMSVNDKVTKPAIDALDGENIKTEPGWKTSNGKNTNNILSVF